MTSTVPSSVQVPPSAPKPARLDDEDLARLDMSHVEDTTCDRNEESGQSRLKLASVINRVRLAQKSDQSSADSDLIFNIKNTSPDKPGTSSSNVNESINPRNDEDEDQPSILPSTPSVPSKPPTLPSEQQFLQVPPTTSSPMVVPDLNSGQQQPHSTNVVNNEGEGEGGHRHWYSTLMDQFNYHRRNATTGSTQNQEPLTTRHPVREESAVSHAANAFTLPTRSNNLETIDFTIGSLAVTGAAAPVFLLRTDEKGRRPMLKLAVADSEVDEHSKQLLFRIELQYGDIKWVIKRTLHQFYKMHLTLSAKRYVGVPKFPSQATSVYSFARSSLGLRTYEDQDTDKDSNLSRRKALQSYLLQLLQALHGAVVYDLYEFLEISILSLTKDMGWKGKEGYVDTKVIDSGKTFCGIPGYHEYDKSWAILRDSYMAFATSIHSDELWDVVMFDQKFYVEHKEHQMGMNLHHVLIGNSRQKIEIKGEHNRDMLDWMEHFKRMQNASPWVKTHRFGSFAPQRDDAKVRYYVDGKDYFHAVSDAILAAKSEIYIADWWLSPELYLRRPPEKNEQFRLDRLLKRKAREGVKIYVVVYKEVSLALTLDSLHTKKWLQDLHPNIQVQRHPDHLSVTATQFWAHHEKICVVDCRLAFIGGLDMCFGRYDSRTHQLSDYHPTGKGTVWPGQDYSNPRIKDFVNVKDYNSDLIERKLLGRMPWHDVSIGVAGQPARDIARHFVQRWNFVKREKGMKKAHMKFLTPKGEFVSTRNESGWTGTQKVQILRSSTQWSQGVDLERSIQDAYIASIDNAEHFIYIENQFFVTLAVEDGNPDIKNKIGIALVNRIARASTQGKKFRVIVVMPLMPAFEADIMSSEAGTLRKVMHFQYMSISRGGNSVLEQLLSLGIDPDQYIGFYGLRSFDRIKHGKFDAIAEVVKEAELQQQEDRAQAAANVAAQPLAAAAMLQPQVGLPAPSPAATSPHIAQGGDLHRSKSLATKYLLDPVPRNRRAAERIRKIQEERRAADESRTWDDSITKKAMNPATREHGYVPKTTERELERSPDDTVLREETREAEKRAHARLQQGSAPNNKDTHFVEGLGTMARSAINNFTQPKTQGGLVPNRHSWASESRREVDRDHDHLPGESASRSHSADVPDNVSRLSIQEAQERANVESIIEPVPQEDSVTVESHHESLPGDASSTAPSVQESDTSDDTIVDNEVDDFVTEQLYIHSKLMIVDDRIIIIGSANINDRSQVGYRDSEIAIIIEDSEKVQSKMNGEPYEAGKMAHSLRASLFKEHLGLLPHVEHDVVTKASVLPVDLDAPHKDPEEARKALIQAAKEQREKELQERERQRQQELAEGTSNIITSSTHGHSHGYGHGRESFGRGWHSTGHLQVYQPDEEEVKAFQQWHSPLNQDKEGALAAKRLAAEDPKAGDSIVEDPLHDTFYEGWWKQVARQNTEIFREIFHCVPDDKVESWDDYKKFVPDPKKVLTGHVAMPGATVENVTERLQRVTGHLVEFPTRFLQKENLLGGVVEGAVVPMEIFT
ncbi:hypothetical protein BG004_007527 [Podila humilis]|nr:hypothetical protein BG004_007527 [Podila humilis]